MMTWFEKLHASLWYRIEMVRAYLAYMRGDTVMWREHEMQAERYEWLLRNDNLQRRFIK